MMNWNYELQQSVQSQLDAGEHLLWYGQPDPKRGLLGTIPIVLFGIPWTAFSLFWMAAALGFRFPDFSKGLFPLFALVGVPFVLIGLGMLATPYLVYKKARLTVYAVTSRRVLIIMGSRSKVVQSYTAKDIGAIVRNERANGTGDLIFGEEADGRKKARAGFLGITDVRRVERILLDTFKKDDRTDHESAWPDSTDARGTKGF